MSHPDPSARSGAEHVADDGSWRRHLVETSTGPGGPPPPGITVLADGPRISAELGVRVTPFALVAGDDGKVGWAGPVTDLQTLAARIGPPVPAL
jgi:hypothetical protein